MLSGCVGNIVMSTAMIYRLQIWSCMFLPTGVLVQLQLRILQNAQLNPKLNPKLHLKTDKSEGEAQRKAGGEARQAKNKRKQKGD